MLDALAAAGVQVAREVGRQADEGQTPAAELTLAYARVSRALRLAIMLQNQLLEAVDTREARIQKAVEDAEDGKAHIRKCRLGRIVERLATAEHPGDEPEVDRLVQEADERLDDMDLYGDLLERPMSELVAASAATSTSPRTGPPWRRNSGPRRRWRVMRWANRSGR
ncbi:MAG: hypothetical protein WDN45_10695 [Caulobacteraceae bacterium]